MIDSKKYKLVLYGAGQMLNRVCDAILSDRADVIAIVDSYKNGQTLDTPLGNFSIVTLSEVQSIDFDYLIISTVVYASDIRIQCKKSGVSSEKIVSFWEDDLSAFFFLDENVQRINHLEEQNRILKSQIRNLPYELGLRKVPTIFSVEDTLLEMIRTKKSLTRFGDGEFESIFGNHPVWFQKHSNVVLKQKLMEALHTKDDHIMVAICDDFGNLDRFTEHIANSLRSYISLPDVRKNIDSVLENNRIYFNAYCTRPYIYYLDREYSQNIFSLWKQVWDRRNILLVEGNMSRFGVGDGLLDNAASVRRILCPVTNSFDKYDSIFEETKKTAQNDDVILITLGAAATVLSYELGKEGLQAIDIGQLDNEYEWYLRGAVVQEKIPGKSAAEAGQLVDDDGLNLTEYRKQIVTQIY